jgi:hypothetical protein
MHRLLFVATFFLVGCATDSATLDLSPATQGNRLTASHIDNVLTAAKGLAPSSAATTVVNEATAAQKSAAQVQSALAVAQQQAVVDAEARAKLEAQHKADVAAVQRRNVIVAIALFVGSLIFYIGEKAKNSNPYTMLVPEVIAGFLSVMIACALYAVIVSLWSAFGWLIHLL